MKEVWLVFLWGSLLGVFSTEEKAKRFVDTEPGMTDIERSICLVDSWPIDLEGEVT